MTKEEIVKIALPMYNDGMSLLQISNIIKDVSYETIRRAMSDFTKKKPRMTNDEKERIIELFDQGYNTVEIQSLTGRDNSSIGAFLKKMGRNPNGKKTSLLKKDEKDICNLYINEKLSTVNIGKMYNVTDRTIAKILVNNGVELREGHALTKIVNHDYFENIDTEEKAYFLGLIIADGSIIEHRTRQDRNPSLSIMLKNEDGYMVERLEQALCNTTGRCYYYPKKDEFEFRGASRKIVDDLSKYGVVPRKTLISYLPTIDEKLMPHLIRGIFDGDGTVYKMKNRNAVCFGFYGTERICNEIKNYLINKIGISDNKVFVKKDCNVSFVYFSKKVDVKNFYHLMYDNATIYLHRKRNVFINHANIELTTDGNTSVVA